MVVGRAELAKQRFDPREIGSLEEIIKTAENYISDKIKEIRIYRETELEDGEDPNLYYLYTRE